MAKTLNISTLAKENRTVVIGDVTYKIRQMNVQDFIELTKTAEDLESREASFSEQLEANIKSIIGMTDIPDEVLRGLTLEQLGLLSSHVRGVDVTAGAEETTASGEVEEAKK